MCLYAGLREIDGAGCIRTRQHELCTGYRGIGRIIAEHAVRLRLTDGYRVDRIRYRYDIAGRIHTGVSGRRDYLASLDLQGCCLNAPITGGHFRFCQCVGTVREIGECHRIFSGYPCDGSGGIVNHRSGIVCRRVQTGGDTAEVCAFRCRQHHFGTGYRLRCRDAVLAASAGTVPGIIHLPEGDLADLIVYECQCSAFRCDHVGIRHSRRCFDLKLKILESVNTPPVSQLDLALRIKVQLRVGVLNAVHLAVFNRIPLFIRRFFVLNGQTPFALIRMINLVFQGCALRIGILFTERNDTILKCVFLGYGRKLCAASGLARMHAVFIQIEILRSLVRLIALCAAGLYQIVGLIRSVFLFRLEPAVLVGLQPCLEKGTVLCIHIECDILQRPAVTAELQKRPAIGDVRHRDLVIRPRGICKRFFGGCIIHLVVILDLEIDRGSLLVSVRDSSLRQDIDRARFDLTFLAADLQNLRCICGGKGHDSPFRCRSTCDLQSGTRKRIAFIIGLQDPYLCLVREYCTGCGIHLRAALIPDHNHRISVRNDHFVLFLEFCCHLGLIGGFHHLKAVRCSGLLDRVGLGDRFDFFRSADAEIQLCHAFDAVHRTGHGRVDQVLAIIQRECRTVERCSALFDFLCHSNAAVRTLARNRDRAVERTIAHFGISLKALCDQCAGKMRVDAAVGIFDIIIGIFLIASGQHIDIRDMRIGCQDRTLHTTHHSYLFGIREIVQDRSNTRLVVVTIDLIQRIGEVAVSVYPYPGPV